MCFATPPENEWGYVQELDGSSLDVCCEYIRSREAYAMAKPTHIDINTKRRAMGFLVGFTTGRIYSLDGTKLGNNLKCLYIANQARKKRITWSKKGKIQNVIALSRAYIVTLIQSTSEVRLIWNAFL